MLDNYGCFSCEHFRNEKLTEDCKWVGYCELDSDLHKRHFIAFDNEKCQSYLPGICITIYNFINSRYNGVTKGEIEESFKNFSIHELDELLEILIKQDYITSVEQDGTVYYM